MGKPNSNRQCAPPLSASAPTGLYTDTGGILTVYPQVAQMVKAGEVVATLRNIFGDLIREYKAPENGSSLAKRQPDQPNGGRILHLGVFWSKGRKDLK